MPLQTTSPITEFSDSFMRELETRILKAKSEGANLVAAFDADGTLWDTDIGDQFFLYQIKHGNLPNMPKDPWQFYLDSKAKDRIKAYYWLAQISVGQKLSQVQEWATAAIAEYEKCSGELPILKSSFKLVQFLKRQGVEVYVVTASVKWAVEPAAARFGISPDHVLGFHTEVDSGVVSDRPVLPATYRQGKADAILKANKGLQPFFCAGNTLGDIALLKCSSHIKLAFRTQSLESKDTHLLQEELALQNEALSSGWLHHAFRK